MNCARKLSETISDFIAYLVCLIQKSHIQVRFLSQLSELHTETGKGHMFGKWSDRPIPTGDGFAVRACNIGRSAQKAPL